MCSRSGTLTAAALMLAGCGYVGEPLPPLANVPARVADMAVVQRGANLMVQFSVPQLTTEGMAIKKDVTLDLRAGPAGEPFNPEEWTSRAKSVEPEIDEGRARATIPAAAWSGKEVIVGVRVIGSNRKDAGWSNFVIVPVVPAPDQPKAVRAEPVPGGVRLTWQAAGKSFRIYRRTGDAPFAVVANSDRAEWTDAQAEPGTRYDYLVQTIVKLGNREAESEPSAELSVTPIDLLPPAVPGGVRAVTSPISIELAWEPNGEPDLAGYRIYRAAPDADFQKLGEVVGGPGYSDRAVEHGKPYRYQISAFDKAGNESKRSEPVEATLP